jgi:hypothetical protein
MVAFDYAAMRDIADTLLQEFGMWATLRRVTASPTDRLCWCAVVEYKPKDAATQLENPTDRWVLISAGLGGVPALPPNKEFDQLVTYVQPPAPTPVVNEILPFTMPVKPISPAGIVVVYESFVRR